ncbi:MAG: hypothetical protein AABY32_05035 [Nanoarchaeota archaeon]
MKLDEALEKLDIYNLDVFGITSMNISKPNEYLTEMTITFIVNSMDSKKQKSVIKSEPSEKQKSNKKPIKKQKPVIVPEPAIEQEPNNESALEF